MTRFEETAKDHLINCRNITELNIEYITSCEICCRKGRLADCNRCVVTSTFECLRAEFIDRLRRSNEGVGPYKARGLNIPDLG